MRYNTPISRPSSPLSSAHKEAPKSLTTYSLSSAGSKKGPIKVKPSTNDMKDTSTVRIANPKFRQHNVEATDDFSAPVAKISQWLASDPTKPKKEFLTVRKGNNIINKSNKFEKQTMAFGEKKQQLQEIAEKTIVTDNRKQFEQGAVNKDNDKVAIIEKMEAKVEHLVEPTADLELVTDILAAASVKEEGEIMISAEASTGDEFSMEVEVGTESMEPEAVEAPIMDGEDKEMSGATIPVKIVFKAKEVAIEMNEDSPTLVTDKKNFEQAKAEFDSGKPNSVQMRKQKLEEMEREARRRANNPYGLMKSSWKRPHHSRGLPSDAWKRTFQGNLPPKKTIAELP
ncbi:hypothetical protein IV203_021968 [Nitzschia inconspicua]|uniref:Uncharacterized protein n=1 Tax=Nitzschia inconspicua TaxID=303405 RepID=A0A9K3PEB6_9STRA|nr:hypothetical protein IV203_021968 [Nitzschia inconspicua]